MKVYLEEGAELLGLTTFPTSRQHTSSPHAIMKFMREGRGEIYISTVGLKQFPYHICLQIILPSSKIEIFPEGKKISGHQKCPKKLDSHGDCCYETVVRFVIQTLGFRDFKP